jgi:acetyl/propionyl-CoA carboxylase alpha subunit/acetyl-CoA carboxylase carboxyltransferase component
MIQKLLVANRAEIAIRIMRTAVNMGIKTVAVYPADDQKSLHVYRADEAFPLEGRGAAAYLDIEQLIQVALNAGCDAIHPGYGFLSEVAGFANACDLAGIKYVGPDNDTLALFGDKSEARRFAIENDVPVIPGTQSATTLSAAADFLASLNGKSMIIKAIAGGGGRGVRVVDHADNLEQAYNQSGREALAAFGDDALYVEAYLPNVRHIEIQVLGDGSGDVISLGERDCSLQRRHQKIIEIAPAPDLNEKVRSELTVAAEKLAKATNYRGAGTFEFLVNHDQKAWAFIEANARLQVEHTITEEIYDIDLVEAQLRIAGGESLKDLGISQVKKAGYAIQLRINMETMQADGSVRPSGGTITAFNPPSGPGVRLDTYAYAGYATNPGFDSMLAKLIIHHRSAPGGTDFKAALTNAYRSLCEFQLEGVTTNISFLQSLLQSAAVGNIEYHTRFIDENVEALLGEDMHEAHYASQQPQTSANRAGATLDSNDPLAVLAFGQQVKSVQLDANSTDDSWLKSPMQGTIIEILVSPGDEVLLGQSLMIMDSMKMEHEIQAQFSGVVNQLGIVVGETIYEKQPLLQIDEQEVEAALALEEEEVDLDEIRPDLAEIVERRKTTLDEFRPAAVARRRKTKQRTARENIQDMCDSETFIEYGQLVLAAQRRRRTMEDLIDKSPADGMITGVGAVNSDLFGEPDNRCVLMSYDYTVFAGTQGGQNHRKTDRMIRVAEEGRMPMVIFAEGGGGRPGDTDGIGGEGTTTFARFAQLSGLVPMIGITSGRCFAGNASLLGCCDLIIATEGSNIGMGGPAMIEGGGLGIYSPEEIGPMSVQVPNGVVDILVKDEEEAVTVAKKYLSYFQGKTQQWTKPDQRLMRRIIPENRLRAYNVRSIIETLADTDSVLEIREKFGVGCITSFIRVEGMPMGVIANNPSHLGGAIDADGADKGARFMQLCDGFDIPLLYLCDTPGIMVGPEIEKTALVRHSSRMFLTGANLSVPFFTIVLRKAYGLGAIAMAGGSYKTPFFTVSWPTGEYGGMGLEGSVKLGYRAELAAIEDPDERLEAYEKMVAKAYATGKALNYASLFSVDDTIDPADSRHWVSNIMKSIRRDPKGPGKRRSSIDAW